jgi:hypothetical protein
MDDAQDNRPNLKFSKQPDGSYKIEQVPTESENAPKTGLISLTDHASPTSPDSKEHLHDIYSKKMNKLHSDLKIFLPESFLREKEPGSRFQIKGKEQNWILVERELEKLFSQNTEESYNASIRIKEFIKQNPNHPELIKSIPLLLEAIGLKLNNPAKPKSKGKPNLATRIGNKIKMTILATAIAHSLSFSSYHDIEQNQRSFRLSETTKRNIITSIIYIGEAALCHISKFLRNGEIKSQQIAIEILEHIGTSSAINELVVALDTKNKVITNPIGRVFVRMLSRCRTIGELNQFEQKVTSAYNQLLNERKKPKECMDAGMAVAKLRKLITKRRNELTKDKGILLDDIPKPPKKGMYQQARRVRNG